MVTEKMLQTVATYAKLDKTQFKIVDTLSFLSKNLYNVGLYNARQHYHKIQLAKSDMDKIRPDIIGDTCKFTSEHLPYSRGKDHPYKEFSNYNLSKDNENYKLLHSDVAQQTLQQVEKAYTSFFKLLKLKLSGNYDNPVRTPHYLEQSGRNIVSYPKEHIVIKKNKVTLGMSIKFRKDNGYNGKELTFKIPSSIKPHQIREVKILPVHDGKCYKLLFVYEIKKLPELELDPTKYLSIDLGVNNFATVLDNATGTATIIDGKYLKSLNRWYNKKNAKLQSTKNKQGITSITHRQHRMLVKRANRINEAMNRFVKFVIDHAIKNNIGNIVCLRWDGIKNKRNADETNNQNFIQIPYDNFRKKLSGKCKLYGIICHDKDNEAYTSRTDALAYDDIKNQPYGKTRRIKRGLYRSITGHLFNADVNGSMNQMRKVAGDAPVKEIASRGLFNRPVRIRLAYESANFSKQQQLVTLKSCPLVAIHPF